MIFYKINNRYFKTKKAAIEYISKEKSLNEKEIFIILLKFEAKGSETELTETDYEDISLPIKKNKCSRCNKKSSNGHHPCPYQSEINDNDDTEYCNCCNDCKKECLGDI